MGVLDNLLEFPTRNPAACILEFGKDLTNAGPLNALVKTVEIATSRTDAAAATIVFEDRRKEDGDYMVADSGLLARWEPIRISADFGTNREEILRGYITKLKPNYPPSGGEVTLEVEVLDESALLDRAHQREVWGDEAELSDADIVSQLLTDTPIALSGDSGAGQSGKPLNQDGTALAFMRNRASANGYELIFTPGEVYFGEKRLEAEPQPKLMVYAGTATNTLTFAIDDDGNKPDAVEYEVAPATDGAAAETEVVMPEMPLLGAVAGDAEGSDLGAPNIEKLSREGDEDAATARRRALAKAEENAFKLRATGEVDGALYGYVLRPGLTVSVDGVGSRYGGLYYVDKVVHRFSEEGYRQAFELLRNATGEGTGLSPPQGPLAAATSVLKSLF